MGLLYEKILTGRCLSVAMLVRLHRERIITNDSMQLTEDCPHGEV